MPTPVYANDCDIWVHKDCFCLEFKMKIGDRDDIVARVLMNPDKFMELAEMIEGVLEGFDKAILRWVDIVSRMANMKIEYHSAIINFHERPELSRMMRGIGELSSGNSTHKAKSP